MPGSAAAAPGWFNWQGMWEAGLTAFDGEIRRRPYHRNCGCALHRSRAIPADFPCPSSSSVSYPIRRGSSWHSLSSSANLSAASDEASPRVSTGGNGISGGNAFAAFIIESSYHP